MKKKSTTSIRKRGYSVPAGDASKLYGNAKTGASALTNEVAFNAMDIQLGGNVARPPATLTSAEVPKDIQRAQQVCFNHYEGNFMVRTIVRGKIDFFNYGCKLKVKGKDPHARTVASWQKLWKEYTNAIPGWVGGSVTTQIANYIRQVWESMLIYDSVVSCYLGPVPNHNIFPIPFVIQPFRATYRNAGGAQRLKLELDWETNKSPGEGNNYRFGQSSQDIGPRMVGDRREGENEHWSVHTRGQFGYGFGRPGMASIFRPLGQCDSMEAGESQIGALARTPMRQHLIGHETRYGPYSGGTQNFYTKKRGEGIIKFFQGKIGFFELVTNFDHKINYIWIDPKWFGAEKWQTIIDRVVWWGQSYAFMFLTKSVNPYLFPLFKQEAKSMREELAPHIQDMLCAALDTDEITLEWGDDCFSDQRLQFEMMKFLTQQGPLSLTTGLEQAGYRPDVERERKAEEASMPEKEMTPLFNPGGQGSGARPPGRQQAGRRPGTPDPK